MDQEENSTEGSTPAGSFLPGSTPLDQVPGLEAGYEEEPEVRIDGYVKLREITRGGQAIVFSAVQQSTGRRVAIKLIKEKPFAASVERSRLDREVRILAALDHPHIVSVLDRGNTRDGFLYFVLNYVDGQTLTRYMEEYRRSHRQEDILRDPAPLLKIFMQACDAVNAAHLRGIVHRDLKPSNIIVDNQGEPHILDFGLARTSMPLQAEEGAADPKTLTGQFVGSLQWASPEQAEGIPSKIDTRTDVYSLGIILYQMLTGNFPYEVGGTLKEVLDNVLLAQPEPPSRCLETQSGRSSTRSFWKGPSVMMAAVDRVVLKALAKKREDRYQTAGELARDVQRCLSGHKPAAGAPPSGLGGLRLALAGAGVFLLGVAGALVATKPAAAPGDAPVEASAPPVTAPAARAQPLGYRIEGGEIVFEFDPRRFQEVRMDNGGMGELASVPRIDAVSVAGPFNEWNQRRDDWALRKISETRWELRKALSLFSGRAMWPFKFVVNGSIWVSAPRQAPNRVVVVEDTSSYNLVLENPSVQGDTAARVLQLYQAQIESAWPGQGANLAMDENFHYHFTYLPAGPHPQVLDLQPLRGIPLATLALYDATVGDFTPLKTMHTLQRLVVTDSTLKGRLGMMNDDLGRGEYGLARTALHDQFADYAAVPAFAEFNKVMLLAIEHMKNLEHEPGAVPHDPYRFKDRRYALIPQPMNWRAADAFARKHGGHLLSITAADEQAWVMRTFCTPLLGYSLWIGGSDEGSEGQWQWTSGETWSYQQWNGAEPNNSLGVENSLELKADGWWNDTDGAAFKYPFVIEWAPESKPE